ncbi:MAG: sodium:calcium antiporter, partial [Planctomycetota bacterium]|nr:sodium:calcium antiporter [Planctomycetota bacterium]
MEYFKAISSLLGGLVLLSIFSDRLVHWASNLALRLKVSPLFIGLTVVAAGTSMPELFVCVNAQLAGSSDLAIGNIVGSNIFNIGVVLGSVLVWRRRSHTQ